MNPLTTNHYQNLTTISKQKNNDQNDGLQVILPSNLDTKHTALDTKYTTENYSPLLKTLITLSSTNSSTSINQNEETPEKKLDSILKNIETSLENQQEINMDDIKNKLTPILDNKNYKFSRQKNNLKHSYLIQKSENCLSIFQLGSKEKKKVDSGSYGRVSTHTIDIQDPSKRLVSKQLSTHSKNRYSLSATTAEEAENEYFLLSYLNQDHAFLDTVSGGLEGKDKHGENKLYIIMKECPGQNGCDFLEKNYKGTVPLITASQISILFEDMLEQLKTTHEKKLQNFDIKYENSMIDADENGKIKKITLIDTGLTKEIETIAIHTEKRKRKNKEPDQMGTIEFQTTSMRQRFKGDDETFEEFYAKFDKGSILIFLAILSQPTLALMLTENPKESYPFKTMIHNHRTEFKAEFSKIIIKHDLYSVLGYKKPKK